MELSPRVTADEIRLRAAQETSGAARTQRILAERTRALAARRATDQTSEPNVGHSMICQVGTEIYAIDITQVATVLPFTAYTPLPSAPPGVLGLFGRNGRIYSLIDLGSALGLQAPQAAGGHLLLLRHGPRRIALRVDRVLAVAPIRRTATSPSGPGPVVGQTILPAGSVDPGETVASVLDVDRLLHVFLASPDPGN